MRSGNESHSGIHPSKSEGRATRHFHAQRDPAFAWTVPARLSPLCFLALTCHDTIVYPLLS